MKLKKISLALIVLGSLSISTVFAADATTTDTTTTTNNQQFSPAAQQAIGKIAADYIVAHPEVLIAATQALQQKEMAAQQAAAEKGISKNTNDLFFSKASPTTGNPDGTIALVEFFDAQCGHCKAMVDVIDNLIKANPNLKVIYKEFPIFGGQSSTAAKAAIAVYLMDPSKYKAFHTALLRAQSPLTEEMIMGFAKKAGINTDKLKTEMNSKAVSDELAKTVNIAEQLRIMGTPYFVIAKSTGTNFTTIPGAAAQQAIQEKIDTLKTS